MGLIGNVIGSEAGKHIGGYIGSKLGKDYKDSGQNIGRVIGGVIGNVSPYKNGGFVHGKKNHPVIIEAHGGEFIVPVKDVGKLPNGLKSKILKNKKKNKR
jgi:outer membrane lipoprotein SlyB